MGGWVIEEVALRVIHVGVLALPTRLANQRAVVWGGSQGSLILAVSLVEESVEMGGESVLVICLLVLNGWWSGGHAW